MKLKMFFALSLLMAAGSAQAISCNMSITLSQGGGGTIFYDIASPDIDDCANYSNLLSGVSNLSISISDGITTWDESHLLAKYAPAPYGSLGFNSFSAGPMGPEDIFWDDIDDGSNDTDIAVFTNGEVLSFDEGDGGSRAYRIGSAVSGTYEISLSVPPMAPVPTLSQWALILMALLFAGLGVRRFAQREV